MSFVNLFTLQAIAERRVASYELVSPAGGPLDLNDTLQASNNAYSVDVTNYTDEVSVS